MKSALVYVLLAISITTMVTLAAVGAYTVYDNSREKSLILPAPKPAPKKGMKKRMRQPQPVRQPDFDIEVPLAH